MSSVQGKSSISVTAVMGQYQKDSDKGNAMSVLCVSVVKDVVVYVCKVPCEV
jgi:hypothetical protein